MPGVGQKLPGCPILAAFFVFAAKGEETTIAGRKKIRLIIKLHGRGLRISGKERDDSERKD
jgi:hypothetical protein